MKAFWLDFETYSDVNLKKVGAHRYAEDPSTKIILTGWADQTGPANVSERFPDFVLERLNDPEYLIYAFNAPFERAILRGQLGWDLPVERFRCVMAWAYHLGFAGNLLEVCQRAHLPEQYHKLRTGHALIKKFCQPRKATKNDSRTRWMPEDAPADWENFRAYCQQDVESERALGMLFASYPMPESEQELWVVDQKINDAGWPVDRTFTGAADKIYKTELRSLRKQLKDLTGLANPNSVTQLKDWLAAHGCSMGDLQAETVRDRIEDFRSDRLHPDSTWAGYSPAMHALTLRQQIARTTPKKYAALELARCQGDRLKGTMQFNGAARTGRWAGRIFQPHNLTRPGVKDIDLLADLVSCSTRDVIDFMYPSVMDALSWAVRSSIAAPPGKKLVVSDFAQVESRLLGWFSGCKRLNAVFAEDRDPYRDFASVLFGIPEDQVTKDQRDWSKPPSLGCGYQLSGSGRDGTGGLVKYAADMGVDMSADEGNRCVGIWRATYPEVPQMWKWLNNALIACVRTGNSYSGYGVTIRRDTQFLMIDLPTGRTLYYFHPSIEQGDSERPSVNYQGLNQYTRQWRSVQTYGGKVTENICQATGRDLLAIALMVMAAHGEEVVGHVHDEGVELVDEARAEALLAWTIGIMSQAPASMPGLILKAEGYISTRFKK